MRRQLAAALRQKGVGVITEVPPPYTEQEHADRMKIVVKETQLTVHLLGAGPGEAFEDVPEKTIPVEQVHLGEELEGCPQLVLCPEELQLKNIDSESYRRFIESLVEKKREAKQFELVRTDRHQMLDAILAKRRQLEEEARAPSGAGSAFIDLHSHDVQYAADLVMYLTQRQIVPVMIPSGDLSPTAGMSMFEENLTKASLFIVVFGEVARPWVEHRLQEAFKIILGNDLKTRIGVYIAPPKKPPDQVSFPPFFQVADNMDHFDPDTLSGLLPNGG